MLRLLAPRLIAGSKRRDEQLRLDDRVYARSNELFTDALQGGGLLIRQEMMDVLEGGGISPAGQRGYHILWHLALTGLICFGPMRGKQPTFALLNEWLPPGKEMTPEEALEELARRYFKSHGPSQLRDFTWWSGLPTSDARAGLDGAKPELVEETLDGKTYWSGPPGPQSKGDNTAVHILPGYDEYIIGYRDRSAVLDERHSGKVLSDNGIFYPTILIDGQAQGTWRVTKRKHMLTIEARPFTPLSKAEVRSLERAAARYGDFMGLPIAIDVRQRSARGLGAPVHPPSRSNLPPFKSYWLR